MSQDRRIRKSKQALQQSLLTLMEHQNFRSITVTDIVRQADLNRGTFYQHYQTKEDIFEEMLAEITTELIEAYREPYKNKDVFKISDITTGSIQIFQHVADHSRFYTLLVQSKAYIEFQHNVVTMLRDLPLQELTPIEEPHHIDEKFRSSFYLYAILGMIIEWVNEGFASTPEYMADQLIHILNTPPGSTTFKRN